MAKKTANQTNPPSLEPTPPSRGPVIVLAAGSIAVAALVGWALTRTVEPAPPAATTTSAVAPFGAPATSTTVVPPAATPASPVPAAQQNEEGVPRMRPDQLKDLVDRSAVTVLDVRDSVSYNNGHIPGAIHIPFARVQGEASRLPKGKPIVAYCT